MATGVTARPRVAVVENHRMLWPALRFALTEHGFDIAAMVLSIADLPEDGFELVICDLYLPEPPSGAAAVATLVRRGWPVLAISGVANREKVLDAIEAGASGFVEKSGLVTEVAEAAWAVLTDGVHISPHLADFLLNDARRRPIEKPADLSARHVIALRGCIQGDTVAELAAGMGLPTATVIELLATALDLGRQRRRRIRLNRGELEVIELVACRHLSSLKIAAELNISPWTVQSRLESARRKYHELHPEMDHDSLPRTVAYMWAIELDLYHAHGNPNRLG